MDDAKYGFGVSLRDTTVDAAVDRVTAALGEVGFGVLTRIDVHSTLKQKLDQDFRPYGILGACNPGLAVRALHDEPLMGLLMPCNVVVQQDGADVTVSSIDPDALLPLVPDGEAHTVMHEAGALLRRALDALA